MKGHSLLDFLQLLVLLAGAVLAADVAVAAAVGVAVAVVVVAENCIAFNLDVYDYEDTC